MHLVEERRFRRKKRKSLVGQSVLVVCSFVLLFCVAFAVLRLPIATIANLSNFMQAVAVEFVARLPGEWQAWIAQYLPSMLDKPLPYELSNYTILGPVVIVLGYVLGPLLVLLSCSLFLLLGIIGPVFHIYPFADGGGTAYYLEPGCGYLVGLLVAGWVCGRITMNRRTSLSQATGVIVGLLALHLTGAIYLFGAYLFFYLVEGSKSYLEWQPWIFQYVRNLTWYSLPYDVIFAFLLVGVSFPLRWLVKTLTIPNDSPNKGRQAGYNPRIVEEIGVG